jgi:hypothetical protein
MDDPISEQTVDCLKKMTALWRRPALRFRNGFLDLNQIKSPRGQTIVQIVQVLRRRQFDNGTVWAKNVILVVSAGPLD